jgi:hypothetical protein
MPANNSLPYEIIGMPFTVYVAAADPVFPLIDAVPDAGVWTKLGTSGDLNYTEDGVTVKHNQSVSTWRSLGDPGPRKNFRTEEDQIVSFTLADMTLEQFKHAMNGNTVTAVPAGGEAGYKKIGLSRGLNIATVALLIRGPHASPYGALWNAQYEIPFAQQVGSQEVNFRRDGPALLALEYSSLVDATASSEEERFGRLVVQTADAIS